MTIGLIVLYVVLYALGLLILWRVIASAVKRGLEDHTIWEYVRWPEMKRQIDAGQVDKKGFPLR